MFYILFNDLFIHLLFCLLNVFIVLYILCIQSFMYLCIHLRIIFISLFIYFKKALHRTEDPRAQAIILCRRRTVESTRLAEDIHNNPFDRLETKWVIHLPSLRHTGESTSAFEIATF